MKKMILVLSLVLTCTVAFAIPARRGQWKTLKLADGTEVRAELRGDEFCRYWQAEDGRKFVIDRKTGLAGEADMGAMKARANLRRAPVGRQRARRSPQARLELGESHSPYVGEKKGLIILVEFADQSFRDGHGPELFYRMANEEGFSEGFFQGSVKDYFKAQSFGQFVVDFDVKGPVRLNKGYAYYGENLVDGSEDPVRICEMVLDACRSIDGETDFGDYDWDGDGVVDLVYLLYAGYGEADTDDEATIWPHQYNLSFSSMMQDFDGVSIDAYACSSELNYEDDLFGIGAICHEFSHGIGLADMYDLADGYGRYGMGDWSIMCSGSYNGGGYVPASYTSYERWYAGWIEPTVLANDTVVTDMGSLERTGQAYVIYNDAHPDEYYLLENRQPEGWDAALPGSGLLILHVDFDADVWRNNLVNSLEVQRCTIFLADNDADVYDVSGDSYPFRGNNCLTDTSLPAATLHHPQTDGERLMHKPVTGITRNDDGTMAFVFRNETVPTGIDGIAADTEASGDKRIYRLDGSYVGTDLNALQKGVYIVGGKKVVK